MNSQSFQTNGAFDSIEMSQVITLQQNTNYRLLNLLNKKRRRKLFSQQHHYYYLTERRGMLIFPTDNIKQTLKNYIQKKMVKSHLGGVLSQYSVLNF